MMRHLVLALLWAGCLLSAQPWAHQPRQAAAPGKPLGGDFELNDARGGTFRLAGERGRLVLIYFGYTSCPDVCPSDLLLLREMLAALGERREQVRAVFISLDPARDTPERLAEYAAAFSPDIVPLTGDEARLRRIVRAYGSTVRYVGRKAGAQNYTVDHPASLYVVGRDGRLARIVPYGTPAAEVLKIIVPLLQ